MNLEEVTETALGLEDEPDLFEWTAGGVHYWERVRFSVHRELRKDWDASVNCTLSPTRHVRAR